MEGKHADNGLTFENFEACKTLLQIFGVLGRLYDVNPVLKDDALAECYAQRERMNRAGTDRGYAMLAIDDLVKAVVAATGVDRAMAQACAEAALAPSKLLVMLDVLKAHERDYIAMKQRQKVAKKSDVKTDVLPPPKDFTNAIK